MTQKIESVALKILLVEDDSHIATTLMATLRSLNHQATHCPNIEAALTQIAQQKFDLILSDFRLEKKDALPLIKKVSTQYPDTIMVVMTAYASYEQAVELIKAGAFDYLPKPFDKNQLEHLIQKIIQFINLQQENKRLKNIVEGKNDIFLGMSSHKMVELKRLVQRVSNTDATVLITGESGSGKSRLAQLIHQLSPRNKAEFQAVFCTTLAESIIESELFGHVRGAFTGALQEKEGKLEKAQHGTLFLDEIGDLSIPAQARLLQFLQDHVFQRVGGTQNISVDTRIIAATNRDLSKAIRDGKFREDLYFRLNVFEIHVPALRERQDDLLVLSQQIISELKAKLKRPDILGISDELAARFLDYSWPGNIRELRNTLERIMILAPANSLLSSNDLPLSLQNQKVQAPQLSSSKSDKYPTLEQINKEHILKVLETEPNLEKAAQILGITSVTLWRKRREYGFL